MVELAVRAMLPLTPRELDGVRWLWFSGDEPRIHTAAPRVAVGAGMLHTECAFSLYRSGQLERGQQHYLIASALIEASAPDELRRRWLLASGIFFHSQGYYPNAASILEAGVAAFPDDATLWLERGALEESRAALAKPWTDLIVPFSSSRLSGPPQDPSGHLADAEAYLERAAELDRTLPEATLRLARVRGELGHRQEAAGMLSDVLAANPPPEVRCLANLFLGRLRERENRLDDAEARYREALAAWPGSQAARTALALVLRREGHRVEALDVVRESLTGSVTEHADDPWRAYLLGQLQSLDSLLAVLRRGIVR